MKDAGHIVRCGLCQISRCHEHTVTTDAGLVVVRECMGCDRIQCGACRQPMPPRAAACPTCGRALSV